MWIVRLALRRPYTFVVMSMLIVLLGIVAITRMPTDIFPEIDIPVISVIFNYAGMSANDMETRIVANFERLVQGALDLRLEPALDGGGDEVGGDEEDQDAGHQDQCRRQLLPPAHQATEAERHEQRQ